MTLEPRRQFLQQLAGAAAAWPAFSLLADEANSARPRIKVGQVGLTHAHASKLDVYVKSPDYEVVGIVEPNETLRDAYQRKPGYEQVKWMTHVWEAGPEFKLVAQNRFESDESRFNGTPAVSDGKLWLRSDRFLYCVAQK